MIQKNVDQFRHILGLSFVQQNIFDMLNTFSRYQQIQAALVMDKWILFSQVDNS